MRKLTLLVGVLLSLGFAATASATKFEFHGDLNNRFMLYTDQAAMFGGSGPAGAGTAVN